jgi:exodeoxyribonuclease V alpha subunit
MVIKGDVDEIRFRNDENGYTILSLDCKGEPVVCVGTFPPVSEGESLEVVGTMVNHPKFGPQIKVTAVKTLAPETLDGIIRYLGSGVIKGIGPKTAYSIVNRFGENTLKVLEFEPHKLSLIKGISRERALSFGAEFDKVKTMRSAVMFLQSVGISLNLAFKIYKVYGAETEAVVKTNPYLLIESVDGVGFSTADKIAAEGGIERDSSFRVSAGIIYCLKEAADKNGNTYMPKDAVLKAAGKLLNLDEDRVFDEVQPLIMSRKIMLVAGEDGSDGLMLHGLYRTELSSAQKLSELLSRQNSIVRETSVLIGQFEKIENIKLAARQAEAVKEAVTSAVHIITGGPGTGKTTIIKCIMFILNAWGTESALMAPTGRAAKRLSDSTGEAASTIHRALLSLEGGTFSASKIIIDEVSMVDSYLLNQLLSAVRPDAGLIFVGDKDQLPSVGAGNVLSDLIKSGYFGVTNLDRVYRQEDESLIVEAAHRINSGKMPELNSKDKDFFFIEADGGEAAADKTVGLVSERLPAYLNCAPQKIQILCPFKNGASGTVKLNERLCEVLNTGADKKEVFDGEQKFRRGDKVMHISNNYELAWRRVQGRFLENGEGVFNGDAGIIQNVDIATGELTVLFEDGREAVYTQDIRNQLVLAYAITVHKSQGSEFDAVIIPVVGGNAMLMTRNLLYTAVTRAKRLAVIVGEKQALQNMINNNYVQKRFSKLADFLAEAQKKRQILSDGGKT